MWLLFAIITAILWGISIALLKKSYTSLSPVMAIIVNAIVAFILLTSFALIYHAKLIIWPLIPVATIAAAGYVVYYYAFNKGNISLIATVQSTYPLFTVILAALFLREQTSLIAKLGIGVILIGLIMLSAENPKQLRKIKFGSWFWWAIAGAVASGSGDFLSKIMVSQSDAYSYILAFAFGEVIVAIILSVLDRKNLSPFKANKDTLYLIASSITLYIGYIFFYLAFEKGLASIVTPISGAYSVVTLFLAVIWLKEKISLFQIIGAIIVISGVILVGSF